MLSDSFDPRSGRAHAATIRELLALVRGRYGSTQTMLAPCGVTAVAIDALRREAPEPAAIAGVKNSRSY